MCKGCNRHEGRATMQWLLTGTWPDNVSDHDAESDSDKCGEANAFNQGRLSFDEIENELSNISRGNRESSES